jgi:hypothetical protein
MLLIRGLNQVVCGRCGPDTWSEVYEIICGRRHMICDGGSGLGLGAQWQLYLLKYLVARVENTAL